MSRTIRIDPLTRLEGHARIEVFLDDRGEVDHAWFEVPELRGFEKFCEGRPAEEMPQITSRICGVCPTAHHMASVKALDAAFRVEPPPAAKKIRELVYHSFMAEDHAFHFYFLGGPDFLAGPDAPPAERNVLGAIARIGLDAGRKAIEMRGRLRELIATAGGKAVHPVLGLPGGVARRISAAEQAQFRKLADDAIDFAMLTLELFDRKVLADAAYVDLIRSADFTHRTHYLGMVDERRNLGLYDGALRVVSPSGREVAKFAASEYDRYIAERTEPWTYAKFTYLKPLGWQGFHDGEQSGIYCVGPMARLNAADRIPTPLAQEAYERYVKTLGPKPIHHTLATHWARLIELLHATERLQELAEDEELTSDRIRKIPSATPGRGVGVVEAPRGTLIHDYECDQRGVIRKANLVVATQGNLARIALGVETAARALVKNGDLSETDMNRIEMAVRAYDPCLGCATHALSGRMPMRVTARDPNGNVVMSWQWS